MNNIQAQSLEPKLDQVELMKQFIGNWEGKFGDNSIFRSENRPFANGIISYSSITTDIIEQSAIQEKKCLTKLYVDNYE